MKKSFRFDFALILIAVFFWIDPMIAFHDYLPDVIGYALLFFGLSRLSDLSEGLSECRHRAKRLVIFGTVQLLAQLIVQVYMPTFLSQMNKYEMPVAVLLCTFLVMLLRVLCLIPTLRMLFAELERFSLATDGPAFLQPFGKKNATKRMRGASTVCVFLTSILVVLPELSVLTSFEAEAKDPLLELEWYQASMQGAATETNWFDWFVYVGIFRVFAFLLALIISIVFLILFVRYFARIIRETRWLNTLKERYETTVLTQTGLLTVRKMRLALGLLFLGSIFTLHLRLGHYPVLPTFFFSILGACALSILLSLNGKRKTTALASIPLMVISSASFAATVLYLKDRVPKDSLYLTEAYWNFLGVRILGALEAIGVILLLTVLYFQLARCVRRHTEVFYENDAELSLRATKKLHTKLTKKLKITFAVFLVATIFNAVEMLLQAQLPWLWLPAVTLSAISVGCLLSFLRELYEEICTYHHSDGVNKLSL